MKKTLIYPFLLTSFIAFSQEKYNPFEGIGKNTEVVTLSHGKYKEIYGGDTLKRIGSVIFDTKNNKVVQFLAEDDTVTMVVKKEGDYATRWLSLDPLAAKYPSMSPYNFVANSPLIFIDPDGREIKIYYKYTLFDGSEWEDYVVWKYGDKYDNTKLHGGDNKFVEETINSLNFLIQTKADIIVENGKTYSYLKQLADAPKESADIGLKETEDLDGVFFDQKEVHTNNPPPKGTVSEIYYHPRSGTIGTGLQGEEVKISPAVGLSHELGHAHRWYKLLWTNGYTQAIKRKEELRNTPNRFYGNAEEQGTMTTYEHRASEVVGSDAATGKRKSHHKDKSYKTTSPTSIQEAKE